MSVAATDLYAMEEQLVEERRRGALRQAMLEDATRRADAAERTLADLAAAEGDATLAGQVAMWRAAAQQWQAKCRAAEERLAKRRAA